MTIKFWGLVACLWLCAIVAFGQSAPPWQPDAYAKDRVCFNVIDYGAKGDSSTNDRAAIQSAIDAAHLLNRDSGAVVYVPTPDTAYLIDSTLALYDHITIEGAGWASLICMAAASDYPAFANADTVFGHDTSIVIRNLRIDGGKSAYSTYADVETADLILLRGVTKPIVEGCYLSYSAKDCIAFRNCLSSTARDNTIWNPGEECITVSGHSAIHGSLTNNTLLGRDSTFEDGSGAKGSLILIKAPHVEVYGNYGKYGAVAIDINGEASDTLHHINVHDNHWESVMGTAITLTGTKWCSVENEHIENCYGYGIYVGRWVSGGDTALPHAVTIKDNIIVNQQTHTGLSRTGNGILVCYGEDHQIIGNTIDTCSGRGIWTSQGATNLTVSDNRVNKATGDAIRLDSAWNSTLSFNNVYDANTIGYYITDTLRDTADFMNIISNRAVGGGGHGFYINNIMSSVICYNQSDSNDYDNLKNGYHMRNCRNNVILGNIARGNYCGFNLNSNCTRNMFSFNYMGGNTNSGITGQGTGNFAISNIHDLGALDLDSLPPVRAYVDGYLAGLEIKNSPAAGQVLKYGTDSVYWAGGGDGGGGTTDSVYVKYADSFNTQGWLTPEDTLFVDTTSGAENADTLGSMFYVDSDTLKTKVVNKPFVVSADSLLFVGPIIFDPGGSSGDYITLDDSVLFSNIGFLGAVAGDSQLVTKKYVDDNAGGGSGLDSAEVCTINDDSGFVRVVELTDSLDEYSLTSAVQSLIEDSLNEYSLTTAIANTYETITNVGLIGDDTTNFKAAVESVAVWDNGAYPVAHADSASAIDTTYVPLIAIINRLVDDSLDEYSLTSVIASTYETVANVGLIGDDTASWKNAAESVAVWDNGAYPVAFADSAGVVDTTSASLVAIINRLVEDSLNGYSLTTAIANVYETIANVGLIGDDTTHFLYAYDSVLAWDNGAYPVDVAVSDSSCENADTLGNTFSVDNDTLVTNEPNGEFLISGDTVTIVGTNVNIGIGGLTEADSLKADSVYAEHIVANVQVEADSVHADHLIVDAQVDADSGNFDHLVINTNLNLPTNTVPDSAADHPVVWQHFLGPAADWGRALAYEIKLFSPVKHDGGTILWMEVSDSTVADVQDTFDIPIAIDFDCTIDTVKYLFKEMNDGYITEVRLYGPDLSDGTNIADSQYWVDITDRTGDTWTTITCARDPGSAISASAGDRYALRFYTNFSASQDDSLCCGWAKMRVTR